jgi:hypothetical protein
LARLLKSKAISRLATYASGTFSYSMPNRILINTREAAFATWSPKLYTYYKQHLDNMRRKLPLLIPNFPKSVFPCATFNFGPRVQTFKHRDSMNCPFGLCAVQALGSYDPTKGGHLVLWDLKLAVQFPPGSCILIPSAVIAHSNVPVGLHETRLSFTQYCAGAIFGGFITVDEPTRSCGVKTQLCSLRCRRRRIIDGRQG